jgi:hypothetical protein
VAAYSVSEERKAALSNGAPPATEDERIWASAVEDALMTLLTQLNEMIATAAAERARQGATLLTA